MPYRCIECGFCESNCPSRDVTLTPRQRITVYRELHRLGTLQNPSEAEAERLKEMKKTYEYQVGGDRGS
jgi:D-lactate dehydrogenase